MHTATRPLRPHYSMGGVAYICGLTAVDLLFMSE